MKKAKFIIALLILPLLLGTGCDILPGGKSADSTPPSGPEKRFGLGGAPIEVIIGLSAESIELTEQLTVTVRIEHAEGVEAEPPYLSESVYSPLLLTRNPQESITWSEAKNRIIKTWTYQLEPMKSGDFALQPFRVFFRLESEKQPDRSQWPVYKIQTGAVPYHVTSVELDEQSDIRNIKGLILPPYNFLPLLASIAVITGLLLLTWAGIRFRKGPRNGPQPASESIDFVKEALRRLDKLESADYISRREFEFLHVELSAVMRYFIENRFGLKALEQTTEEFIRAIGQSPHFGTEQQVILRQFLELADLVKFATYDPGSSASREAMKTVRDFIESTRGSDAG